MKIIAVILLSFTLLSVSAQTKTPPFVSAKVSSIYTTNSTDTLNSIACDPSCLSLTYSWAKVSGPGSQTIANSNAPVAIISGLQTGWYIFKSTVTSTTGASNSDTVGILVNAPMIKTIHDTLYQTDPVLYSTWDGKTWHYYFKSGKIQ